MYPELGNLKFVCGVSKEARAGQKLLAQKKLVNSFVLI